MKEEALAHGGGGAVTPKTAKYIYDSNCADIHKTISQIFVDMFFTEFNPFRTEEKKEENVVKVPFISPSEMCLSLPPFLSAVAKLRNATISFVMSVRPHGTNRLPLDEFS